MGTVGFPSGRQDARVSAPQESSVVASIQDILRDAQVREDEEKLALARLAEAQERMRVEQAQREREAIEERARDEEEQRQRRAFEERRQQVELSALHEATIARAKTEAESQTRLVEIAKQQEHERHLALVRNDVSKRRVSFIATSVGVAALAMATAGGVFVKKIYDEKARIERDRSELKTIAESADADAKRFRKERDESQDPARIAELERKLADARKAADEARSQLDHRGSRPSSVSGRVELRATQVPQKQIGGHVCLKGDPACE